MSYTKSSNPHLNSLSHLLSTLKTWIKENVEQK